jgi:NAD(P)-dependent dehydrogenase (short-subunit alcohol dehydrogenase family)
MTGPPAPVATGSPAARWMGRQWARWNYARRIEPVWLEENDLTIPVRDLSPEQLARAFAINTIGPALVLKHFTPLLAREGRSVIAALSAKVGSIGDNELGGWYGYRASKAALNQVIRTTSIELKRSRRDAICVALHPGTVDTPLSAPFSKAGLNTRPPEVAASELLSVIAGLSPQDTGSFLDYRSQKVPW